MAVRYTQFYDQMQSLIDSINHDSDPAARLGNIQRLTSDSRRMMLDSRDAAAYELRTKYSSQDAEQMSGVSRRYIDYWAKRWMKKNDLPRLRQQKRRDLSNVVDLSDGGRFPTNPRR